MDVALWFSLVGFVCAMSYTPGPNNFMVMSSSALFGVRRTLPHWLGVNIGFNFLLIAGVFGLGELIQRYPVMLLMVKIGGALWLAWMASQFVRAAIHPLPAALFQLINPKALMMTISAAGAYVALAETAPERALIMVVTFILFGSPGGLAWMFAAGTLKPFMSDPRWARILNAAIAGIILLTLLMVLFG